MPQAKKQSSRAVSQRTFATATQPERSATVRRVIFLVVAIVGLCALVFVAYGNSVANGFVWDDNQQVVMNPNLRSNIPVWQLFSGDVWSFNHRNAGGGHNYYRPFQMLTYRAVTAAWGMDPRAFHLLSIAFHLLVVLLLFAFCLRLSGHLDLAFAAAGLFAVHPIHSEAVDWISALPDLGCTAFILLAYLLLLYARPLEATAPQNRPAVRLWLMVFSWMAFAAALLWKETAIVFPLLVLAYAFCDKGSLDSARWRSALLLSLPFWCILGGYFLLRLRVLGFVATRQRNWTLNIFQLALTEIDLLMRYWGKLVAPVHLNAYHVFSPVQSVADPRSIVGIVFLSLAVLAVSKASSRAPQLSFAANWVFITLIPVLDIYAVGRNVFAERYLYLPSVGFCLLVVLGAARLCNLVPARLRRMSAGSALVAVLVFFAAETISRNPDWKDDATLFPQTLELSPSAPFVQNMVGEIDRNGAASSEAENHYQKAIYFAERETPPDRVQIGFAYEGLAALYAEHSDFDRALNALEEARMANPQDPELDAEQGLVLVQGGHWVEAERLLRKAIVDTPNNENVLNALGLIEWQRNHNFDEATRYFMRALAVHKAADEFSASLHNNLAAVYGEENRLSDAIAELKRAVSDAPNDPAYHTNLAQGYMYAGKNDLARAELETALGLAPNFQPARAALNQLAHH